MKINDKGDLNLQDAFKKFRKKRVDQIKSTNKMNEKLLDDPVDIKKANLLREKFLSQALKYIGVPYAKRYHEKGSPCYDSPLFLDCCGLVRRVLIDLKYDFGFRIGRWNQGYQFDTLPITLSKEEDMKPGKKQKHDMVHVEIWLGDGEKTIGARYQKGRIQIHDSYKFVSKTYHSMVYHFKSIDTWLKGICRSFCNEHPWKQSKYINHGKHSIFAIDDDSDCDSAGDDQDDDDDYDHDIDCDASLKQANSNASSQICIKDPGIACDAKEMQLDFIPLCCCIGDCVCDCLHCEAVKDFVECSSYAARVCTERYVMTDSEKHVKEQLAKQIYMKQQFSEEADGKDQCSEEADGKDQCSHELAIKEQYAEDINEGRPFVEVLDKEDIYVDKLCLGDECVEENGVDNVKEQYLKEFNVGEENVEEQNACKETEMANISCDGIRNCAPGDKSKTGKGTGKGKGPSPNGSKSLSSQSNYRRSRSQSPAKPLSKPVTTVASTSSQGHKSAAPKFYIGGHNGVALVEKPLLEMGWNRITDNKDLSYYLKWVECKSQIDYKSFKEGEQIVNHIPNGSCLTSKHGLLQTLLEYERITNRRAIDCTSKINLSDFYPETYNIDSRQEIDVFCTIYKAGETWICKPSGLNQGKGIFIVRSIEQLRRELEERAIRRTRRSTGRVISRYLTNPLLLNGCKFDIRAYMLIASTTPYMVFYHPGYVRLSCVEFSNDSNDITAHLTNQYIQKKHPDYSKKNDSSVWTMEMFNEYVKDTYKEEKDLPDDWVKGELTHRMKEIMLLCFRAAQNKLQRRCGYFDLLGFDFMIDADMKVWLIEINVNPALFTNCASLQEVVPGVVDETLKISIEAFENKCSKKRINRLTSVKNFELLYDGERNVSFRRPKVSQPRIEAKPCDNAQPNADESALSVEITENDAKDGIQ